MCVLERALAAISLSACKASGRGKREGFHWGDGAHNLVGLAGSRAGDARRPCRAGAKRVFDIDRQLLLLREIEARMAFAEFHIKEQEALVRRLSSLGLTTGVAHDLLRSMKDSLVILESRRRDLVCNMRFMPEPLPPSNDGKF
jgi:hypothetical protein